MTERGRRRCAGGRPSFGGLMMRFLKDQSPAWLTIAAMIAVSWALGLMVIWMAA